MPTRLFMIRSGDAVVLSLTSTGIELERKHLMKTKLISALIMALTLALLVTIIPAMAFFNNVSFGGQGFVPTGADGYGLQTEICGVPRGADSTGPYLFWTLTAPGARNAEINGPWGSAIMNRGENGTFTYISGWYDPEDLMVHPVKVTYDGKPAGATLVVSHGCDPSR
jgi:hypothetical protein